MFDSRFGEPVLRRLFLSFAALASAAGASHAPHQGWSTAATQDINAGYRLFRENHPGWDDPTNPGFRAQLERARKLGLLLASAAKDEAGYEDALGAFSATLSDGHARLVATDPAQDHAARWPGFTVAWRGQRLLVAETGLASHVLAGAEVLECDGKPIRKFIEARLASRGMRPAEPGQWWSRSPRALVDSSDASGSPPTRCNFRMHPGSTSRTLRLHWSPAPQNFSARLKRASDGERTEIGLSQPRAGLFLIGLPDFEPDEGGRAAYRRLFAELKEKRADLRHARAVVIDLRYNDGGSGEWGLETARVLWGAAPVDAAMAIWQKQVQIWWRASAGNTAYVRGLEAQLRQQGRREFADELRNVLQVMETAHDAGRTFAVEPQHHSTTTAVAAQSDFFTPVYVITPGRCASACLDAVDIFKRFPNTRLIGAPTSADSAYLDVRTEPLPSGHGIAIIPTKLWMYRPRKGGEVYMPDVEAKQLDWSTKTFLDLVEAQVRR